MPRSVGQGVEKGPTRDAFPVNYHAESLRIERYLRRTAHFIPIPYPWHGDCYQWTDRARYSFTLIRWDLASADGVSLRRIDPVVTTHGSRAVSALDIHDSYSWRHTHVFKGLYIVRLCRMLKKGAVAMD